MNFDEKELGKLARKLKKEKVNVDIICFGEEVSRLNFKNFWFKEKTELVSLQF